MIKYDSQKIQAYWPYIRRQVILALVLFHIFNALLIGGLLMVVADLQISDLNLWLIVGIFSASNILITSVGVAAISRPHRDLFRVISRISTGVPLSNLPDMNAGHYKRSGFSEVMKFIYNLDTTAALKKEEVKGGNEEVRGAPLQLVDDSSVSVVILDSNNQLTFRSKGAPELSSLIFTSQESLNSWLDSVRENKITAEHHWRRIPDSTASNDDRQIYDIYARFKKGAKEDAFLFFINKTDVYTPDEDDLNFIAFAAHELRGPITIIRGYLDVLNYELKDSLSLQQTELFKRLIVSSNKLSGYINNILNVSRFDRDRLAFDLSEHTLSDLINSIREDVILRANSQNRLLEINIDEDLPTVGADLSSISEVLTNLIDNAIKYSNEGGLIKINTSRSGEFIDIDIQDFGIGIPTNVMNNLFQKFYRSHRSRETVAGTGIGLYISRAIIEGHGGQISVKSVEGEGSTFTVSLPVYSSISDKLLDRNNNVIKQPGGGWIKNHGKIRS